MKIITNQILTMIIPSSQALLSSLFPKVFDLLCNLWLPCFGKMPFTITIGFGDWKWVGPHTINRSKLYDAALIVFFLLRMGPYNDQRSVFAFQQGNKKSISMLTYLSIGIAKEIRWQLYRQVHNTSRNGKQRIIFSFQFGAVHSLEKRNSFVKSAISRSERKARF